MKILHKALLEVKTEGEDLLLQLGQILRKYDEETFSKHEEGGITDDEFLEAAVERDWRWEALRGLMSKWADYDGRNYKSIPWEAAQTREGRRDRVLEEADQDPWTGDFGPARKALLEHLVDVTDWDKRKQRLKSGYLAVNDLNMEPPF